MQLPLTPPAWVNDAICPRHDPDTWFPSKGDTDGHTRRLAKRICAECPVARQCLEYALANNEKHGVWGGYTEPERNKIKKQRRELVLA